MTWQLPTAGQWNPGMAGMPGMHAMAPDMSMGSYTPEQWAAMQQQNWQQWTQWQQQYAQWQNQYGDKYTEQMQAIQAMGGMPPPPPTAAPPPAPPPPDKPPPPPHENNQPLFDQAPNQPAPVPAPNINAPANERNMNSSNLASLNNQNKGNNPNWSYNQDSQTSSVNAEALKKLSEEERLFDIQFQKWEEEIEKWKADNVNHPDKQAYKEYEDKFEACRVQLLERRRQMNLKRARLIGTAPPPPNSANTSLGSAPPPGPPPSSTQPNLHQNQQKQPQNYSGMNNSQNYGDHSNQFQQQQQQKPQSQLQQSQRQQEQNLQQQPQWQQQHNQQQQQQNQQQQHNQQQPQRQQQYNQQQPQRQQQHNQQQPQRQQQYNMAQKPQNRNNTKNINPQNRYDAPYNDISDNFAPNNNYSEPPPNNSNFLPSSAGSTKGIPGLDLVPDHVKPQAVQHDVIDITGDKAINHSQIQAPDYTTISKGINNILGDEKIMNILSMVRQTTENMSKTNATPENYSASNNMPKGNLPPSGNYGGNNNMPRVNVPPGISGGNNQQNTPYGQGNRNQNYNNPTYDNRQNVQFNRQGQNFTMQNNQNQEPNMMYPPPKAMNENRSDQMPQEQYNNYDRDMQYRGNNVGGYNNPSQRPDPTPLLPNLGQSQRPPQRPLIQDMPPNFNNMPNDFQRGTMERKPLLETNMNIVPKEPAKPHWVHEPMFTPSILVDYEHKPLRLKARDFIEPVHMFDYNHKSKDGEVKKDFGREAEELFTRKPRRPDSDYISQTYYRDQSSHYERRMPREHPRDELRSRFPLRDDYDVRRDEMRPRFPPRDDYEDRRRPERYDERRKDDRDKYGRREDAFKDRDRERDYDRSRDTRLDDRDRGRDIRVDDRDRGRDIRTDDRDRGLDTRIHDRDRGRDTRIDDRDRGRDNRIDDRDRGRDNRIDDRDRGRDNRIDDRDRGRDNRNNDRDHGRESVRSDEHKEPNYQRSESHETDSRKRGHSKDSDLSDTHMKKSKDSVGTAKSDQPQHIVMIDDILESPGRTMRPEKIVIILRGPPGSGKSYLAKLIRDREAQFGETVRIMSIDDYFMQEGEVEEKDPATGKLVKKPTLKYEYDESSEDTYLNSLKRAFKRSLTDGYFTFLIYDAINETLKSYADIWNLARQNGFQVYVCTMDQDAQICFKRNIHNRTLDQIHTIIARFFPTPAHHIQLDPTTLLQSAAIPDVQMEDADDEVIMEDVQEIEVDSVFTSKWETKDDAAHLARLDGISKPLRPSQLSMEDYLQLDDWKPNTAKPGKKTVRWADIEERRQQEKMRAIGFVVGQTDWNRMTDPTMGSSALTQTKYIERVRRN